MILRKKRHKELKISDEIRCKNCAKLAETSYSLERKIQHFAIGRKCFRFRPWLTSKNSLQLQSQPFYPVKIIFLIKNKCVREVVVKSFVDPLLQFEPIIGPMTLHQPPSLPVRASLWGETRAVRYIDSIHSRFDNASISHCPASLLSAKN